MTAGHPDLTIDEHSGKFLDVLNSLNFGPLAYKLMHPEDGPGLSLDQTTDAITKYKGFRILDRACEGRPFRRHGTLILYGIATFSTPNCILCRAPCCTAIICITSFFWKTGAEDHRKLREAADFTIHQAKKYFNWDDDEWCGTVLKPKWPHSEASFVDLVGAMFPAGTASGVNQNPDTVAIHAGNFRHTVEYLGVDAESQSYWRSGLTFRPKWGRRPDHLLKQQVYLPG